MITCRALLVGVGGQGVLTAAQIVGAAAHASGLPVVVGQLHGMSQRGGSIECTVKIGPDESTVIGAGEADVVLAFEPLEALRSLPRMRRDTRVVVSVEPIVPFELTRTGREYPPLSAILSELRAATGEVVSIDGRSIAGRSGAARALNAAMIGAAAGLGWLPIDGERLLEAALARTSREFREANQRAFELGREAARRQAREARV